MSAAAVVHELDPPARQLADVVAPDAHPAPVGQAGGAARAVGPDVVQVPYRGVAERIAAAAAVADPDQVGEHPVETPAAWVGADQAPCGRGEQMTMVRKSCAP